MQAAMLGIAGICIIIGVYPQCLYALLPYPVTFVAYDPIHIGSAIAIMVVALAFFFTLGKKLLAPHETRLVDFDLLYLAISRGVMVCARLIEAAFRRCYQFAVLCARMCFSLGGIAMGLENRDPNWNIAMFGSVLVALATVVILGVAP
jgi:multicomponent Na+:H+ antiporter subunit D